MDPSEIKNIIHGVIPQDQVMLHFAPYQRPDSKVQQGSIFPLILHRNNTAVHIIITNKKLQSSSFRHLDIRFSCLILSMERACNGASQSVCTEGQTVRLYCITNSSTNCFTMLAMAELIAQTHSHLGIGVQKISNGEREGEVSEEVSLVTIQPFTWEKKRFL